MSVERSVIILPAPVSSGVFSIDFRALAVINGWGTFVKNHDVSAPICLCMSNKRFQGKKDALNRQYCLKMAPSLSASVAAREKTW